MPVPVFLLHGPGSIDFKNLEHGIGSKPSYIRGIAISVPIFYIVAKGRKVSRPR